MRTLTNPRRGAVFPASCRPAPWSGEMWTPDIRVGTELPRRELPPGDAPLTLLATMTVVEGYVTGWAGTDAFLRGLNVRLGVPAEAGDVVTVTGTVTSGASGVVAVEVRARSARGVHATGTVRLSW